MRAFLRGVGFALLALVGVAFAQNGAQCASRGGTINVGVDQEAVGLDPNLVTAFSSFRRIELMYDTLVRYDDQGKLVPDLASSWDVPDPTTYIFHLRHGVKFHDGSELTSADVAFTIQRILDKATSSPARSYLTPITSVETPDKYTVTLKLDAPTASLLDSLTSGNVSIVSKAAVEKYGDLQRNEDGTGPFVLGSWTPDQSMTLKANPDYFESGYPCVDQVVFKVIPQQASLLAALRSGTLDLASISDGNVFRVAQSDSSLDAEWVPGLNVRTFGFNTTKKPFDNVKVRQAISLAIDRQQLIAVGEQGFAKATGPVPIASTQWALDPSSLPYYTRDIVKAKQLLTEAGYPNGFTMSIMASPTYEGGLDIAQVIQQQLSLIGIKANVDSVEWGTYIDRWVKRDFEGIVELRGGAIDPDRFLYRTLTSNGAVNNFLFKDPHLDALLNQGRSLTDQAARKKVYDEAQRYIAEQAPVIFLYAPATKVVMRKAVKNFRLMANGSLYYLSQASLAE